MKYFGPVPYEVLEMTFCHLLRCVSRGVSFLGHISVENNLLVYEHMSKTVPRATVRVKQLTSAFFFFPQAKFWPGSSVLGRMRCSRFAPSVKFLLTTPGRTSRNLSPRSTGIRDNQRRRVLK